MQVMGRIGQILAAGFFAGVAVAGGAAWAESQTYDIYFQGLRAAELTFRFAEGGGDYSASGAVTDAGILGRLVNFRYSGEVSGRVASGALEPGAYSALNVTKDRERRIAMEFRGGTPVSVVTEPARAKRAYDLDPATQTGVVDPLTAAGAVGKRRLRWRHRDFRRNQAVAHCHGGGRGAQEWP
jgi:Protein of unknown function (DUF3108)